MNSRNMTKSFTERKSIILMEARIHQNSMQRQFRRQFYRGPPDPQLASKITSLKYMKTGQGMFIISNADHYYCFGIPHSSFSTTNKQTNLGSLR